MSAALEMFTTASCDRTRWAGAVLGDIPVEGWLIELDDVPADLFVRLHGVLSAEEVARADRFHFAHHRRRFVVARGALRFLLSPHLGIEPAAIGFAYGPAGKPSVKPTHSGRALFFNVTHAENLAVVGITRAGEMGVDLERVRVLPDWEHVARATFTAEEVEALRASSEACRPELFFRMWTREEARVKALGVGLGDGGPTRAAAGWRVQTFSVPPSFLLSVAVPLSARVLPLRQWEGEVACASLSQITRGSSGEDRPTCC